MTASKPRTPRPLDPHGTRARFAADCRCDACTAAHAARMPVASAVGPARMARALVARGFPTTYLSRRMEVTTVALSALLAQDMGFIPLSLADTVRALYTELRGVHPFRRGVNRGQRSYALKLAARNGWPAPEAWDDATIDDPDATPVVEVDRPRPLVVLDEYEFYRANFGGDDPAAARFLGIDVGTMQQNLRRAQEMLAANPELAMVA